MSELKYAVGDRVRVVDNGYGAFNPEWLGLEGTVVTIRVRSDGTMSYYPYEVNLGGAGNPVFREDELELIAKNKPKPVKSSHRKPPEGFNTVGPDNRYRIVVNIAGVEYTSEVVEGWKEINHTLTNLATAFNNIRDKKARIEVRLPSGHWIELDPE